MIVIISKEQDFSTNDVIDWLIVQNKKWIRINETDIVKVNLIINKDKKELVLNVKGQNINFNDIASFWYRREDFNFGIQFSHEWENFSIKKQIENHVYHELKVLKDYIHYQLQSKRGINNKLSVETNKLINLQLASEFGLSIPQTVISQNKEYVEKIFSNENIITKAISESLHLESKEEFIQSYTEEVDELVNFQFPSLFQEKVEKKFEVRSFFLDDKFYSMAIFSQRDEQTRTDFRKYNQDKPNRTVPYNLPPEIEYKLKCLSEKIGVNSGSFDLIVDHNNDHIFLEINPVGQFGMVSYPCNYSIEKLIADYL